MSVADARVKEAKGAKLAFAVTLSAATDKRVMVRYATSDGSAKAGEDYKAKSGRLAFAPGETAKTIEVKVLDDAHDEGEETLTLTLSEPTRARLSDAEATGTIENADLMPAALLARFGRATAEQVVEHIEERMAAPRRRGFRARFAGRELQRGGERDFALGFLSQFAQPMGFACGGWGPDGRRGDGCRPDGDGLARGRRRHGRHGGCDGHVRHRHGRRDGRGGHDRDVRHGRHGERRHGRHGGPDGHGGTAADGLRSGVGCARARPVQHDGGL